MSVFLFYGQEEYLMDKQIKKLKDELLDTAFISMAYKVFDNPSSESLLEILESPPLMFGAALNIIHIDKYLLGKQSLDDKQLESIEFALKNIPDSVNIIFVCKIPRDENKKADSRKKFYKLLSKYAQVREFPQYPTYNKKELPAEILAMAKEKELSINSDNIANIIEQLGSNLTLIDSELEKLKIAVHPKKNIEEADIKKYCISSEDIFSLADLIISGNKNEILRQYNLLTEKRHPLEIFAALQSNLKNYTYIKNYENKLSDSEIASRLKMKDSRVYVLKNKIKSVPLNKLLKIRENLIEAEYKMKTGQSASSDIVLELALLS
ncbi:DNA polymerase III subunit delta [bacterium]|nr:DNA polymerase III subunit delta [bacterium]